VHLFRRDTPLLSHHAGGLSVLPVVVLSLSAGLLLPLVGYVLWPSWPSAAAPDVPSIPIVVGSETFNVPPAAIRTSVQRHAGRQDRIDLTFQWPSLNPPDPAAKLVGDRLFVTIAVAQSLPPSDRLSVIYPRYAAGEAARRPDGLLEYAFRDGTPYQGEDLLADAAAPQRFAARCSRRTGPRTPGMCLHDRRIGDVDVSVRFPRDWLDQWRSVADGIDRLVDRLTSHGPK
jgi:hypothetical protein